MTKEELFLSNLDFDYNKYADAFNSKIDDIKSIAIKAAKEYGNTYRQGGKIMRFSDIFRKFKRLEKEFLHGHLREREKTADDLKDLAVYCIVFWIYLDELDCIGEIDD